METQRPDIEEDNIVLLTDSYKISHWKQDPPGTQNMYSYFESRGGIFPETQFFGLQYQLKKWFVGTVVTKDKIDFADYVLREHFGNPNVFNRKGWEHILNHHDGKLPLSIRAVPEGTVVPTKNVLITCESTDPNTFWLPGYTNSLLTQNWYPTKVATFSMNMKKLLLNSLERTGNPANIDFMLHDFGFRGTECVESARIGAAAHLLNFKGTDTLPGIVALMKYYNAGVSGFSVPAAEHETITSWGKDREPEAVENILNQFPTGVVSVVSDSYDIYKACREIWGERLRDRVLGRDGVVVVRPDSGEPEKIVVEVLEILGEKFGTSINQKGYKVLPPQIRVIQGDGINYESTDRILKALEKAGWSADNLVLGMGGALLQNHNRDDLKFAFKCSSVTIDGVEHDVYKQPITDIGKASKAGRLKLILRNGEFSTVRESMLGKDQLVEVFRNGRVTVDQNLDEIRERALTGFLKIMRRGTPDSVLIQNRERMKMRDIVAN